MPTVEMLVSQRAVLGGSAIADLQPNAVPTNTLNVRAIASRPRLARLV
jgi:hypothetical protein